MRLSPESIDRVLRFVDSVAFVAVVFVFAMVIAALFAVVKNLSGI